MYQRKSKPSTNPNESSSKNNNSSSPVKCKLIFYKIKST